MRGRLWILVLAVALACCSRPPSREFFILRENAEYGDTYSFFLDLDDSTQTYSLDFFTRLERRSFGDFPEDRIMLDIRWFSPEDSILADTAYVDVAVPAGSAYYTRDFVSSYKDGMRLPVAGEWRLKARIVNDSETVRGLGIIVRRD